MGKRILIAEDDEYIVELLKLYLSNNGYEVDWAADGAIALEMIEQNTYSLMLVDIMMPVMNGYELISRARSQSKNIPIIVISAKDSDAERILGLDTGADAYLAKPFNPLEVVAYVNSAIRRYYSLGAEKDNEVINTVMKCGELELNLESHSLSRNGAQIRLTRIEYQLLLMMMKNPGKIYTISQLHDCIHSEGTEIDANSLRVHISNLRSKVETDTSDPQYIKNVRGIGYKFEKKED